MSKKNTVLREVRVNSFRGLKNINIAFGERITLICGKNGTSKSTILGVIAQTFSFRKDYTKNDDMDLSSQYKTINGKAFESLFSDHFRLSEKHDTPGSMDINIYIYDGSEDKELSLDLGLYNSQDRSKARPIVRGNTTTNGASSSRNVTHPVIYLSLKRLMPIALRAKYSPHSIDYLNENKNEFNLMNNQLLGKMSANKVTATTGTVDSVVVHGDTYDQDSVSAGEDNVGQILQAIFSFKKLKSEYEDYRGGILLIDEADAGLFPAAQVEFIHLLSREAKHLNLQIIMTSHSPTMIEKVNQLSEKDKLNYKTIYLTDTFGSIEVKENLSWPQIYADLHIETINSYDDVNLPKINIYFEDKEGVDFFSSLITERQIKKPLNVLKDITLGCGNYKQLIEKKIPEFSKKSIIVLDGDVSDLDKYRNVVKLPSKIPPDQLIFEFLYNLPPEHEYWRNKLNFTKPVFYKIARDVINRIKLNSNDGEAISVKEIISAVDHNGNNGVLREVFKAFYKNVELQKMINGGVKNNPFRLWALENSSEVNAFKVRFLAAIKNVWTDGHGIDTAKISGFIDNQE